MPSQNAAAQNLNRVQMVIPKPNSNENITINIVPSASIAFDFDESAVSFERTDNSLVISNGEGGKVILNDFFKVGEGGTLPDFVSSDGTVVAGADFLHAISPDMDIATAAGPTAQASTSGLGSYGDDAGSLLSGVDRLGTLGTSGWTRSTENPQNFVSVADAIGTGAGAGPQDPGFSLDYDARAVIYTKNADDQAGQVSQVAITFRDANGDPVNVDSSNFNVAGWKLPTSVAPYFDFKVENGVLTLTLNAAGKAALASGQDLVNYLRIVVDGQEHTIQVIADVDNRFDSQATTDDTSDGFAMPGSNLAFGEWHEGHALEANAGDNNTIHTSGLGDSVVLHDGMKADTGSITINLHTAAGKTATVEIDGGINKVAMGAANGGSNTVDGSLTGTTAAVAGTTNVTLMGEEGMNAASSGSNTVRNVSSVEIDGSKNGMNAEGNASNTISNVSGAVQVSGGVGGGYAADRGAGMRANTEGANTIKNVDGTVTVEGEVYGMLAKNEGSNSITGVDGDVTLDSSYSLGRAMATERDGGFTTGGSNLIDDVEGNVFINSSYVGMEAKSGSNTINDVRGSQGVEIKDTVWAMYTNEGSNTISDVQNGRVALVNVAAGMNTIGGDNKIENVGAKGVTIEASQDVMRVYGGSNTIDNVQGNVTLQTAELGLGAVEGSNTISNVQGNVSLTHTGNHTFDHAMQTTNTGQNIITGVDGSVEIRGFGTGMHGSGAAGSGNTISNVGSVVINTAHSGSYNGSADLNSTGMYAVNSTENIITGVGNRQTSGSVLIDSNGYGMSAWGGTNKIADVNGDVELKGEYTAGMHANSGNNYIGGSAAEAIKGNVKISGYADGMKAQEGSNTISHVQGTEGVTIMGKDQAMNAVNGNNTISDVSGGKVSLEAGTAAMKVAGTGSNTIQNVGTAGVELGSQAFGMLSSQGGENLITAVKGNVDLKNIASTAGTSSQAMQTLGGKNTISSVDGTVTVDGFRVAMSAQKGGINTIEEVDGDVHFKASTGTQAGYGMDTESGSNIIRGVDGTVLLDKYVYGMRTDNNTTGAGLNEISDAGNVEINAGWSGMYAHQNGHNLITNIGESGTPGSVKLGIGVYGMEARGGENEISQVHGNVELQGKNSSGGMHTSGGSNTIKFVDGTVTVDGVKFGMNATDSGANIINNVGKGVSITSTEAGMIADTQGTNSIHTIIGEVNIKGHEGMYDHNQYGQDDDGGHNSISNVTGNVVVTSTGNEAMNSSNNGSNTIGGFDQEDAIHGSVTLNSVNNGMFSFNGGSNNIINAESVNIKTSSAGMVAGASLGKTGGENLISDVQGNVTFDTDTAMRSMAGKNTIQKVDEVEFNTRGHGMESLLDANNVPGNNYIGTVAGNVTMTYKGKPSLNYSDAMYTAGGINKISDVDGEVTLTGFRRGMFAHGKDTGLNEISETGSVKVTAVEEAMHAYSTATNKIYDIHGDVSLVGQTGMLAGYSSASAQGVTPGGTNLISKIEGDVLIGKNQAGETKSTYGMQARYDGTNTIENVEGNVGISTNYISMFANNGGSNTIDGVVENLSIDAAGMGMFAFAGGSNNINNVGGTISLNAVNSAMEASAASNSITGVQGLVDIYSENIGLNAYNNGTNTISAAAGSSGIEVRITVPAGTAGKYGLYANNGTNKISGGDGNDQISIHGNMKALADGKNIIETGSGSDRVSINGDVTAEGGGSNTIKTGSGSTLIELDGVIKGLTIETHGEYEVLILRADSPKEFSDRYKDWLTLSLTQPELHIDEVKVIINGSEGESLNSLGLDWLNNLFGERADILSRADYDSYFSSQEHFADYAASKIAPATAAIFEEPAATEQTAQAFSHDAGQAGDEAVAALLAGQVPGDGTALSVSLNASGLADASHIAVAEQNTDFAPASDGMDTTATAMVYHSTVNAADAAQADDAGHMVLADALDTQIVDALDAVEANDTLVLKAEENLPHLDIPAEGELGLDADILDLTGVAGNNQPAEELLLHDVAGMDTLWQDMASAEEGKENADFLEAVFQTGAETPEMHLSAEDVINLEVLPAQTLDGHSAQASANVVTSVSYETYGHAEAGDTLTLLVQNIS